MLDYRDEVAEPAGLAHKCAAAIVGVPAEFAHHCRRRMEIVGNRSGAGNGSANGTGERAGTGLTEDTMRNRRIAHTMGNYWH
ncbi:hypothetical protein FEZ60_03700 [Rhodococcus sp. MS16]|uniref:hypothetical protein n=1 Tax=Rhodococcus sp. MS16 TaxID=2579941 RepID=UPI000E27F840|nr:hypothetical protein [Rhodococcus sp. MS16]NRI64651.1 hypothetical protein [Rhodococcus sp. MS16]